MGIYWSYDFNGSSGRFRKLKNDEPLEKWPSGVGAFS